MPKVSDAQILAYIRTHTAAHGRRPTMQQIADHVGMSQAGIWYRLHKRLGIGEQFRRMTAWEK